MPDQDCLRKPSLPRWLGTLGTFAFFSLLAWNGQSVILVFLAGMSAGLGFHSRKATLDEPQYPVITPKPRVNVVAKPRERTVATRRNSLWARTSFVL
jgi:hypothetical protein